MCLSFETVFLVCGYRSETGFWEALLMWTDVSWTLLLAQLSGTCWALELERAAQIPALPFARREILERLLKFSKLMS